MITKITEKISNKTLDKIMSAKSIFIRNRSMGDLLIANMPKVQRVQGTSSYFVFLDGNGNHINMPQKVRVVDEDDYSIIADIKDLSYIISLR